MLKTKNIVIAVSILLLVSGWVILPLVWAAEGSEPGPGKECTMQDLHKCTMKCTQCCETTMKDTAAALVLLDEALKAMDTGDTADVKVKIEKAKMMLNDMQAAQKTCLQQMPAAVDRCPMTGKKIGLMSTPEDQTRLYKGRKIGFCSPACPPAWEKLTDAEKDAKLEKVMPTLSEKEEMTKNISEVKKMQEKQDKGI